MIYGNYWMCHANSRKKKSKPFFSALKIDLENWWQKKRTWKKKAWERPMQIATQYLGEKGKKRDLCTEYKCSTLNNSHSFNKTALPYDKMHAKFNAVYTQFLPQFGVNSEEFFVVLSYYICVSATILYLTHFVVLPRRQKKNPVDFDDELKIGDVRYDNMI